MDQVDAPLQQLVRRFEFVAGYLHVHFNAFVTTIPSAWSYLSYTVKLTAFQNHHCMLIVIDFDFASIIRSGYLLTSWILDLEHSLPIAGNVIIQIKVLLLMVFQLIFLSNYSWKIRKSDSAAF